MKVLFASIIWTWVCLVSHTEPAMQTMSSLQHHPCSRQRSELGSRKLLPTANGFEIKIFQENSNRKVHRFNISTPYKLLIRNRYPRVPFKDFYITAVLKDADPRQPEEEQRQVQGEFVHTNRDGATEAVRGCAGLVRGAGGQMQVFQQASLVWVSPSMPTGCVQFRAVVLQQDDTLVGAVSEDGSTPGLSLDICPQTMYMRDTSGQVNPDDARQSQPLVQPCCACGTATYRITYQGVWTKRTFPQQWPRESGLLHWTNILGASHDPMYGIYYEGGLASQAVQSICAYGDGTVLDQEFQMKGKGHIKNLINMPGIWRENELEDNRTQFVAVNKTHNLVSLITMMGPSPDWCTGLSYKDLCQSDCSWADNHTVELRIWDAGIKEGNTYISNSTDRQDIPDPIRVMDQDWPRGSPFQENRNNVVAKVHFERVYPLHKWQCVGQELDKVIKFKWNGDDRQEGDLRRGPNGLLMKNRRGNNNDSPLSDPALAQMATFLCITSEWSPWTMCSVTCGVGKKTRSREMKVNKKNELCRFVALEEMETCEGRKRTCDYSESCSLLPWSEWSACNGTCLQPEGYQTRSRMFAHPGDVVQPACMAKLVATSQNLNEVQACRLNAGECDPVIRCSEGRRDGFACGQPQQRFYYDAASHTCIAFTYLGCKGSQNNFESRQHCEETCLMAVAKLPQWRRDKMALLQFRSASVSDSAGKGKKNSKKSMDKAMMMKCKQMLKPGKSCSMDEGSSEPVIARYYFEQRTQRCRSFEYRGCDGNENNFVDYNECMKTCMPEKFEMMMMVKEKREEEIKMDSKLEMTKVHPDQSSETMPPELAAALGDLEQPSIRRDVIFQDCVYSAWGGWSPCSQLCGMGKKRRWRSIAQPAMNGGRPCSHLSEEMECEGRLTEDGCQQCDYSAWSNWSACSQTCGLGIEVSERERLATVSPQFCVPEYPDVRRTRLCNEEPCKNMALDMMRLV